MDITTNTVNQPLNNNQGEFPSNEVLGLNFLINQLGIKKLFAKGELTCDLFKDLSNLVYSTKKFRNLWPLLTECGALLQEALLQKINLALEHKDDPMPFRCLSNQYVGRTLLLSQNLIDILNSNTTNLRGKADALKNYLDAPTASCGESLLTVAAEYYWGDNKPVLDLLLQLGADINHVSKGETFYPTPLFKALYGSCHRTLDLAKRFIDLGADTTVVNNKNMTIYDMATSQHLGAAELKEYVESKQAGNQ